ncbi:MAG: aldehyde oxidase and xanthine dehydrogenase, middle chain [Deltaproteobacteria bacterium]|nr:aldehyde oxidase and xanthine dehydrogenase, middle chain [Deltaproteobacteria bacterium]
MGEALYFAASTMSEAMKLLGQYGKKAVILAGGTDLVPRINTYGLKPGALIYIGKLGLDYIKEEKGRMVIGAATPMAKIAGSKLVAKKALALAEAALQAGTAAVRTAGTIGGNLANASPAADLATPLLVLDADLSLVSQKKKRVVALKEFFKGPGQTLLQPGEMIKEISFPIPKGKTAFVKLGRRKALTLSVVNAAVRLEVNRKKCQEVRIALGSVAPIPLRCPKAEGLLTDQEVSRDLIEQCASEAMAASSPIDDQRASAWYRKKAGVAVVARALAKAAGLEKE